MAISIHHLMAVWQLLGGYSLTVASEPLVWWQELYYGHRTYGGFCFIITFSQ